MKLIDVDTLDDYLGKWADDFYENPENSDADFMDGYCMTLNRIHSGAFPEVDAIPFKWTPCSERLPEEVGTYLVTVNFHGRIYVCMDNFLPSGWELMGWTRLAWAKMPQPYKGETE